MAPRPRIIASKEAVDKYGLKPIAKLKYYTTVGCEPDEMGVGPRYAIPKLLDMAGLKTSDIGLWEINEAFASQALYSIRNWAWRTAWTTSTSTAAPLHWGTPWVAPAPSCAPPCWPTCSAKGVKYGVESMCIGGGMGAAALFELPTAC
jgi:acetyl-CoA acyltransferase